ncbi:hypothetical protein LINPERHAP2_LOCUS41252 [Linum perenne]
MHSWAWPKVRNNAFLINPLGLEAFNLVENALKTCETVKPMKSKKKRKASPKARSLKLLSLLRPKARRGLGLRKARELNQAYLMKLEWPFLKTPINKLWVRVVTRKYLKETDSVPIHHRKSGGSSLWREICSVWHEMRSTCQLSIRNSKDTHFFLNF